MLKKSYITAISSLHKFSLVENCQKKSSPYLVFIDQSKVWKTQKSHFDHGFMGILS